MMKVTPALIITLNEALEEEERVVVCSSSLWKKNRKGPVQRDL